MMDINKGDNMRFPNDDDEDSMSLEDRRRVFVLYFEGLDRIGAPYGISELTKKARELKLPIPSIKEMESWKRVKCPCDKILNSNDEEKYFEWCGHILPLHLKKYVIKESM